jgi:Gram-negative porin
VRIQSSLVRGGVLFGFSVGVLLGTAPAAAEVTLFEKDGYTFFTDGRVNVFASQGAGDDFPRPSPNTNIGEGGLPGPEHTVVGSGQPFTAGYSSDQGDANGKYSAMRIRSGFLGSILALGIRKQLSATTTVRSYISLWGTAQSFARDRVQDAGQSTSKSFDVREGFVNFEGPWGAFTAGRQGGIFGSTSTEIDFLYGHNYGLGLPCIDNYFPTCGHIGTGALGPGTAAGFVYTTPSLSGLRLRAGLYDPVRLLGVWERVSYVRPEAQLMFEQQVSPEVRFKLAGEAMYQPMAILGAERTDSVWGVSGGGRLEAGPIRLGASAFHGKGLGVYIALQNNSSSFNNETKNLRTFTGVYGQSALVLGPAQISLGAGRVLDDQLPEDKIDATTSGLKSQFGVSLAFYYTVHDNVVLGFDYFRFQTDWWGAPNSVHNAMGAVEIRPGVIKPEKQVIHFINAGVTFRW